MKNRKNKTKKITIIDHKRVEKRKDKASLYNQLELGKSIVSERFPNTIDEFWFIINANMIVNSFDFVSVNNLHQTTAIGIVKEVQSTFLSNQEMVSHKNNFHNSKEHDSLQTHKSSSSMEDGHLKMSRMFFHEEKMGNLIPFIFLKNIKHSLMS
jgi:hypothetical protein